MKKLVSIILAVSMLFLFVACTKKDSEELEKPPEPITGNEWLMKQTDCLTELQAYAEGMDDVITLYVAGSITAGDFQNEVAILKQQYAVLLEFYNTLKAEYPVEPETHSYLSKRGSDALQKVYDDMGKVLDGLFDPETGLPYTAEHVAYVYIGYRQGILDSIAEFTTAVELYLISEEEIEALAPEDMEQTSAADGKETTGAEETTGA